MRPEFFIITSAAAATKSCRERGGKKLSTTAAAIRIRKSRRFFFRTSSSKTRGRIKREPPNTPGYEAKLKFDDLRIFFLVRKKAGTHQNGGNPT